VSYLQQLGEVRVLVGVAATQSDLQNPNSGRFAQESMVRSNTHVMTARVGGAIADTTVAITPIRNRYINQLWPVWSPPRFSKANILDPREEARLRIE
jgi:hypothetical protein